MDARGPSRVATIVGASVVVDGSLADVDVTIANGMISAIEAPGRAAFGPGDIDGRGCVLAPGFVDVQLNGAAGFDFTTEPDRLADVAAALPATGVTSFLPTVITSSPDHMARAISVIGAGIRAGVVGATGARPLGLHVEGPFIASARRGAHPGRHVRDPDLAEAAAWLDAAPIALVTLAPERPSALELIAQIVAAGATVSVGHTEANVAELAAAVDAGATAATHLFNAMGSMSAREPGPAGAVIADERLIAGLIVDGLHVDPTMVLLAWRALGPRRVALVTDAMAALLAPTPVPTSAPTSVPLTSAAVSGAAGSGAVASATAESGEREWWIGRTRITVGPTGARTDDGVLAGSVLRMDDAFRNLIAFTGCSVAEASIAASTTPARLIGRDDIGSIRVGARADLVLLDARHRVVSTMIDGVVVYVADDRPGT